MSSKPLPAGPLFVHTSSQPADRSLLTPFPRLTAFLLLLPLFVLGCSSEPDALEIDGGDNNRTHDQSEYLALAEFAVFNPDRPEQDRVDDELRKPDEVLAFSQITPGMRVLDVLAGGGYYTELLSAVVGQSGQVVCQNNSSYLGFLGETYDDRFKDNRLPNVARLDAELADLSLDNESFDAVVFVLGYHDTYYEPPDGSWPQIDNDALLQALYAAVKPGGVALVIDHAANPGGDTVEVATTLHRIDPVVALADFEKAGFVLEAESHTLRNPNDNKTINVFDPTIRRQTDRFIYRFRKGSV